MTHTLYREHWLGTTKAISIAKGASVCTRARGGWQRTSHAVAITPTERTGLLLLVKKAEMPISINVLAELLLTEFW